MLVEQSPGKYKRMTKTTIEMPLKNICEGCLLIGDTGASSHMTNITKGYISLTKEKTTTTFGAAGDGLESEGRGIWIGRQYHVGNIQKQPVKGQMVKLENVLLVPGLRNNLFSITKAMSEGAKIRNHGDILVIDWGDKELKFDFKMKTQNGFLMAEILFPIGDINKIEKQIAGKVEINDFHARLGHRSKNDMVRTTNRLNINLVGQLAECLHCARAKIIRKKIPKRNEKEIVDIGT